jgi:type VI secretion system secreted protein VgrG
VLSSPAGIHSTTPQSTHQQSGGHHAITSSLHTSISAAKSFLVSAKDAIRLFAYKSGASSSSSNESGSTPKANKRAGIKITSAQARIDIQALRAGVNLLAKLDITMTADRITLGAKKALVINGGGSYTRWDDNGITSGTTGSYTIHAAEHVFVGPKGRELEMPQFAQSTAQQLNLQYQVLDNQLKPIANSGYFAVGPDGAMQIGKTDATGKASQLITENSDSYSVHVTMNDETVDAQEGVSA